MGLRLRQERKRRGWTLEFVAQQVGVSKTAMLYLETSKTRPSYEVLVKLEDLFGMGHRELFAEETDAEHDDHPQ